MKKLLLAILLITVGCSAPSVRQQDVVEVPPGGEVRVICQTPTAVPTDTPAPTPTAHPTYTLYPTYTPVIPTATPVPDVGRVFYVDAVDGDDGNNGYSLESAWRTIAKANQTLQAGDTVYILEGTYRETISPAASGQTDQYITYARYQDHQVIIAITDGFGFAGKNKSYITIDGIAFHVEATIGYFGWGNLNDCDHWIIRNCTFTTANGSAERWDGVMFWDTHYSTISDCKFGTWGNYENAWGDAVRFFGDYNVVEGCEFWPAYAGHSLLNLQKASNCVIRRNRFRNLWQKNLESPWRVGETGRNLIEDNVIYDAHEAHSGKGRKGLQLSNIDCIVRYNLIVSNDAWGLDVGTSLRLVRAQRNKVYNNTIYDNGEYGVRCIQHRAATDADHNIFKNNIIAANGPEPEQVIVDYFSDTFNENEFKGNCIFHEAPGENVVRVDGIGSHSLDWWESNYPAHFADNLDAEPMFVDPEAFDYSLQPESPCVDAGVALTLAIGNGADSRILFVKDAGYFSDGFRIVDADWVKIGSGEPVQIYLIDYEANVIVLAEARSWSGGDAVNLYKDSSGRVVFYGAAPDVGASEYGRLE